MERIFLYPCLNGVIASANKKDVCANIGSKGKVELKETINKKQTKHLNLFLVGGLFYLIYGVYYTFCGVFFENDLFFLGKKDGKKRKINKIFLVVGYVFLLVIFTFFAVLFLGLIPLNLSYYILPKTYNIVLKRIVVAIIKVLLIFGVFALLKILPPFKQFYKFNGACKKWQEENGDINFLSYFIVTFILNTFVISLLGFSANVWYFFLINIFISAFIFITNYQVYKEFKKIKWFNKIIFPLEWLVSEKSSQIEQKCVNIVLSEINKEYKKGKNMQEKLSDSEILFSEAYFNAKEKLQSVGKFEESDLDFIFCEVLGKKRNALKLIKTISMSNYNKVMEATKKRCKGEPITKIFGKTEFYGLNFVVTKDVLSPRMDTEVLVEEILKEDLSKKSVLDIGTGSGAIAISIAKLSKAKVTAVDVSEKALEVALTNAKNNDVKINFVHSDLFASLTKKDRFDIIVSNPPYIPTKDVNDLEDEVKNYDPSLALDGGDDGLNFYREIIDKAPNYLTKNGKIFFEVGINQANSVKKLLQKNFKDIRIVKDYNKIERVVCATIN